MILSKGFLRARYEAIQQLFSAAFPFASIVFPQVESLTASTHGGVSVFTTSSFSEVELSKRVGNLTDSFPDHLPCGLRSLQEVRPSTAVWQLLYDRYWGPATAAAAQQPGAYPRCPLLPGEKKAKKASSSGGIFTPAWVPDAIIHLGGYESTDLRQVILPKVVEHVPLLPPSLLPHTAAAKEITNSSVASRRRPAPYVRAYNLEKESFAQKGCLVHGEGLLEITLPVLSSSAAARRVRVFVVFANPSHGFTALLREPQARQRAFLRQRFGSSLPLLQQALPRPAVLAVMAIRKWQAARAGEASVCSSAFWISCVAHLLSAEASAGLLTSFFEVEGEGKMGKIQEVLSGLAKNASDDSPPKGDSIFQKLTAELNSSRGEKARVVRVKREPTSAGEEEMKAEEEWRLASLLAKLTVQVVRNCSESEWSDIFLRNFFLPQETFVDSLDAQRISVMRKGSPMENKGFFIAPNFYRSAATKITSDSNV